MGSVSGPSPAGIRWATPGLHDETASPFTERGQSPASRGCHAGGRGFAYRCGLGDRGRRRGQRGGAGGHDQGHGSQPAARAVRHLDQLHGTQHGQPTSDELDAALAAGGEPVAVFHQRISVGEIPDLASCDGETPPGRVVDQWLHYGPLLVPGRAGGPVPPAIAALTVPRAGAVVAGAKVAITLYFARAGQLTLDLPVDPG